MNSSGFLAFRLFLKSAFFTGRRVLKCSLLVLLVGMCFFFGLFFVFVSVAFSVLLVFHFAGFLGQYSHTVNFMATHLPWFSGFHLGCFGLVVTLAIRAQGLGVFKNLKLWQTWPTIPDADGKEISSWIAIPYWLALFACAGPLLTVLAAVGGARLLVRFIRNLPAFLRQKRDHILDTNPEALAQLEKARLGVSLGEAAAPVRKSRL
jgi:hypothetical protein